MIPACSKASKQGAACSGPLPYGHHACLSCLWCDAKYYRCEAHGGLKGARRSLGAHKGICPKRPGEYGGAGGGWLRRDENRQCRSCGGLASFCGHDR